MLKLDNRGVAHLVPLLFVLVLAVAGSVYLVTTKAAKPSSSTTTTTTAPAVTEQKTTGNGAPSGSHYQVNIIGVPKAKTADLTGDNGRRIFVPLEGVCKINLSPGVFGVQDANCSDGSPAAFQLPIPDGDADGEQDYTVWARPLGKPGGKATSTTCATDPTTGEELCSLESTAFVRNKGKSSFENVSKGFLTMLVDLDGDPATAPERLSIFDDRLQDYFWNYDNQGLKNLQIRFYQK